MADLRLSRDADADFDDMLDYGTDRFGADAADRYAAGFDEPFDLLRTYPQAGAPAPQIGDGVRSFRHREHKIYYEIQCGDVIVLRVLHHSRNVDRWRDSR